MASTITQPPPRPECFASNDECDTFARAWLTQRGFDVVSSDGSPEVTPKELRALSGLSSAGIYRRLAHPNCPPFRAWCGTKGRIWRLVLTPALRAWITAPKRPGKRREQELPLQFAASNQQPEPAN